LYNESSGVSEWAYSNEILVEAACPEYFFDED